jgi:hypothetical protein
MNAIKISYAVDPLSVGDENPADVAQFIADAWAEETDDYDGVEINVTVEPSLGNVTVWCDDYETLCEIENLLTDPNILWEQFCRQQEIDD